MEYKCKIPLFISPVNRFSVSSQYSVSMLWIILHKWTGSNEVLFPATQSRRGGGGRAMNNLDINLCYWAIENIWRVLIDGNVHNNSKTDRIYIDFHVLVFTDHYYLLWNKPFPMLRLEHTMPHATFSLRCQVIQWLHAMINTHINIQRFFLTRTISTSCSL